MRMLDHLLKAVRAAAVFNPEVQMAPACILWPDRDRQWEAVVPSLQKELPELFVLGDYDPEKRTGPAIWLRCVMAGTLEDISIPEGRLPILYLPGVGRQDLRVSVNFPPEPLRPLVELQYRGVLWSQINAKDWTILAFLKADQGGLGLDVAQDRETRTAMQLALHRLLDEDLDLLRGKRLDRDYFNTLLTGGDPVRDLLQWLDGEDVFRQSRTDSEWQAFVDVCTSHLGFNPAQEGVLAAAAKLASREGPWQAVWERFCEAPQRYVNIPQQIRKCRMPDFDLFEMVDSTVGWPQWNDDQEESLRRDLAALSQVPSHEARQKIRALQKHHGQRTDLVWAELGEAPLALALRQLRTLAEVTSHPLAGGTMEDLAAAYAAQGWHADHAVLCALDAVHKIEDIEAVTAAVRAVYLSWAEESARYLQKIWTSPASGRRLHSEKTREEQQCVLFVDGLRFDCAKRLAENLVAKGFHVAESSLWAALPTVTATCKPAIAPLQDALVIAEEPAPYNFEPISSHQLKKLFHDNGWVLLQRNQSAPAPAKVASGRLWVEVGDIDHEGHSRGWKLAQHIDVLLQEILDRIKSLLDAGWPKVRVVTDHGWLLLPGGLPKIDLPAALTDTKWSRCALVKPGATTQERLFPWFWNPHQFFALADGISCYRKGEDYTHGGVSLQETLLLELAVTAEEGGVSSAAVEITDLVWQGMRCKVAIEGRFSGLHLDIRRQAGDPDSSQAMRIKPVTDQGKASVVVDNDELEGQKAHLVLVDEGGRLVAQEETVIGGDGHD